MFPLEELQPVSSFRDVMATETKQKEAPLSVERVPGTLSIASKSVQVNGAATVRIHSACAPPSWKACADAVLGFALPGAEETFLR